ncbi:beta-phosphoglucomutase [Treponema sp. C6A8]|uniref:beta-phosphoglucomutase n=1 Tax=Treponema sp. C6A8 TaxID=1410609 RepID=UPI00068686CA|nr:beta-phosphoglucomutase [Treponema sp. C6A8]
MIFKTDKFGKDSVQRNETLFTLGNGNIGMRGDTEEKAGTFHKGTYINGFFDKESILYGETAYGYAKNHETILNLPDAKRIEMRVNGAAFAIDGSSGKCESNSLSTDLEKGILTRECDWENGQDKIHLHSERLVSFKHENCAAIRYCVKNIGNAAVEIEIASAVDISAGNILAEDDPRIGAKFRHKPLEILSKNVEIYGNSAENGIISFTEKTAKSGLFLAGNVRNSAKIDGICQKFVKNEGFLLENSEILYVFTKATLQPGKEIILEKYITYCWKSEADGGDINSLAKQAEKECEAFADAGFDAAVTEQKDFLSDFWKVAKIKIDGDEKSEEALHFSLFHLLQSASRTGKASIGAKGLTSEGYEGHFFWDTESYVCPVFTYTMPQVAKKLLEYRGRILPKAEERAAELNLKGALYPWRTIDGEETSAYYPAGTAQYHIDADIIFALNRFLNAHGDDLGFDQKTVEKMCAQTARMWESLGAFIPHKGNKFCINDVTGPDEYTAIVNNNAFTNFMARENLEISAARSGSQASDKEKSAWKKIAENMYIPFDKELGIYPQDDSFLDKADWDFENTPKSMYPLLMHYHPLEIYRHKVLKQPDLVLAHFLLSGRFSKAEKIRNFKYYQKYTTGDSSLSYSIMSIMANEAGDTKKAFDYYNQTVRMDIDDVNGNSRDGIHTACMAGSWMSTVYGFAGFRDYGGLFSFDPKLPESWKGLEFSLAIKGFVLDVSLTHDEAKYSVRKGCGKCSDDKTLVSEHGAEKLVLIHRNEKFELGQEDTLSFSLKKKLGAVLFDLDGVITNTAPLHYKAWKEMADAEGLRFDEEMNKMLLGISREESLEVILRENGASWTAEKKAEKCFWKNERYKELLKTLTPDDILPGIKTLLGELKAHGVPAVLASSSKNAPAILDALKIWDMFAGIADANRVQKAKPEADIFLEAAELSGAWYTDCVGVEDAEAGVAAIKKGGMTAVGISPDGSLKEADVQVKGTGELTYDVLINVMK